MKALPIFVPMSAITGLVVLIPWFVLLTTPAVAAIDSNAPLQQLNNTSVSEEIANTGSAEKAKESLNHFPQSSEIPKNELPKPITGLSFSTRLGHARGVELFLSKTIDRIIAWMIGTGNFLNARSNIEGVDKYMSAFNNFFNSRGGGNWNNYYFIINNWWVIYDATAMFFRSIENRKVQKIRDAEDLAKEEENKEVIDEAVLTLNEANDQLVAFKNNLAAWICRNSPNIARNGVIKLRRLSRNDATERQIDCSSLLERLDKNEDEEEQTEEDQEVNTNWSTEEVGGVYTQRINYRNRNNYLTVDTTLPKLLKIYRNI